MIRAFFRLGFGFIGLLVVTTAWADQGPICPDTNGQAIGIENAQILQWKTSTPNNWENRGHVSGTIVAVYPNQTGHQHFGIQIGPDSTDLLEVVFDLGFGPAPDLEIGESVEACGDYITAYAQSGHYPPSPDGALIHWIHKSDEPGQHPDGFLIVNGVLYGQDLPNNVRY